MTGLTASSSEVTKLTGLSNEMRWEMQNARQIELLRKSQLDCKGCAGVDGRKR